MRKVIKEKEDECKSDGNKEEKKTSDETTNFNTEGVAQEKCLDIRINNSGERQREVKH